MHNMTCVSTPTPQATDRLAFPCLQCENSHFIPNVSTSQDRANQYTTLILTEQLPSRNLNSCVHVLAEGGKHQLDSVALSTCPPDILSLANRFPGKPLHPDGGLLRRWPNTVLPNATLPLRPSSFFANMRAKHARRSFV